MSFQLVPFVYFIVPFVDYVVPFVIKIFFQTDKHYVSITCYLTFSFFRLSREIPKPDDFPRGGILADEMGLGIY